MNEIDLPPLPPPYISGPQVCATIRLYIAILDDLSSEQVATITRHLRTCENCATEQRVLRRSTQLIGRLEESVPSARVDRAILAAASARASTRALPMQHRTSNAPQKTQPAHQFVGPLRLAGSLAAAAVVLLALFLTVHFFSFSTGNPEVFQLPNNLSWSSYVLYHSETKIDTNGVSYSIECYHYLGVGAMHVETTIPGYLDVVVVGASSAMLGMDMIHHVAQWSANNWSVDDSAFDLGQLRRDLQANRAVYLGKGQYNGQAVYRIRLADSNVLLLDMNYQPVNMLQATNGTAGSRPMYDTVKLLAPTQVSNSMWSMSIPPGFHMGTLPTKP